MFELTGTLKLKKDEQKVSDSFKKRELVVTDNSSQYPQYVTFQLTQDRCSLADNINPGDEVKISFFIRGREWKDPNGVMKYFNSLDVYRMEKTNSPAQQSGGNETSASSVAANSDLPPAEEQDDLPF